MGAHCAPLRKKKSSAVPYFRSGHMSVICAGLGRKGKVGVQRGRKTAGCPSFLPPRRAPRRSRRLQTANPPLRFSEKLPARWGRTRLRQFAHPAQPVLKKLLPGQGEPPARFRCPNRPVQRKRVPHTDICPPVKTKYFYALHYKSDVL